MCRQRFQGFAVFIVLVAQRRNQTNPEIPHLAAAKVIVDRVLQDALEQRRKFFRRFVGITLDQLQHRVLHDIERRMVVLDGELSLFESASFNASQKRIDLLGGGHNAI